MYVFCPFDCLLCSLLYMLLGWSSRLSMWIKLILSYLVLFFRHHRPRPECRRQYVWVVSSVATASQHVGLITVCWTCVIANDCSLTVESCNVADVHSVSDHRLAYFFGTSVDIQLWAWPVIIIITINLLAQNTTKYRNMCNKTNRAGQQGHWCH